MYGPTKKSTTINIQYKQTNKQKKEDDDDNGVDIINTTSIHISLLYCINLYINMTKNGIIEKKKEAKKEKEKRFKHC